MFKWTSKKELATSDERKELGTLNRNYTDCLAKEFLPAFLEGKDVKIDNFCVDIRQQMLALEVEKFLKIGNIQ